jgi:hypothetical protein
MALFSNTRLLWISIIVLVLLNLITLGALWTTRSHRALSRWDRRFERPDKVSGDHQSYFRDRLKLNDDQAAKFKDIKEKQKQELEKKFTEIRGLRQQLMVMVQQRDFNDSAKMTIEKISQLQSEVETLNYEHFRELLNICDENQKKLFIETMKEAFMPGHGREFHDRQRFEDKDEKTEKK